jgi:hypothetical protein
LAAASSPSNEGAPAVLSLARMEFPAATCFSLSLNVGRDCREPSRSANHSFWLVCNRMPQEATR